MTSKYNEPFIGSSLRLARELNGMSIQELSDNISVSRIYLHGLESGWESVSDETIEKMANLLDVLPEFFFIHHDTIPEDSFNFN